MNNAVKISIDNPAARKTFIRWWRTMEAQGYQYGFEALCNVWVGFDDGRADLAQRVIEVVEAQKRPYGPAESGEHNDAVHNTITVLRELFQKEGVQYPIARKLGNKDAE